MEKATFWQRLKAVVVGRCFLEYRTQTGWRGFLPFTWLGVGGTDTLWITLMAGMNI